MKTILVLFAFAAFAPGLAEPAQQSSQAVRQTGTLRIVVKDPSGAVIPNAVVRISGADAATADVSIAPARSDGQGVATVSDVPVGRYALAAEVPGFETRTLPDVRVRTGDNRRDVMLPIEKLSQSVAVGRDAATAASDPRSDRFSNVL